MSIWKDLFSLKPVELTEEQKRLRQEWAEEQKNPMTKNLMLCPDCKKQVSRNAEACPHCGRRFKAPPQTTVGILSAIVLAFLFISLVLALMVLRC